MDEIAGGGIRIEHDNITVKVTKNDANEITLVIGDTSVTLSDNESGFLLAYMADWYEKLDVPLCSIAGCANTATMRVSVPGASSGIAVCDQHGPSIISIG